MGHLFLNEKLLQRWIGRIGAQDIALCAWPPRSLDLTVCDFFLWVFVTDKVFVPPLPTGLDNSKYRITATINSIDPDMLQRV